MKIHQIALPHIPVNEEYVACAYQQKILKFAKMMTQRGHSVVTYAPSGSEVEGELVETHDPRGVNEDYKTKFFDIEWDANGPDFAPANAAVIEALRDRVEPYDLICVIGGVCQQPIAQAFPNNFVVEHGIGYRGVFANYKVFESYAWKHWVYGSIQNDNVKFYDTVIPNYFDLKDFPAGGGRGDYFLFVGRLIDRKGWRIAVDATERLGAKLIMAGQTGGELPELPDHVTHVGHVNAKERAELMGNALATFVPTTYIEPFGGVAVESMLCGTPVVATDAGAFVETVVPGVTGFRANLLSEFVQAAVAATSLNRETVRNVAVSRYSLNAVAPLYENYFDRLSTLYGEGWYS